MIRKLLYKTKKKYFWPKAIGLCYHRVEDYLLDPSNITVSEENFISHLEWLKYNVNIIKPDDFKTALLDRKHLPDRSVILTFDDGYDSYKRLAKILDSYNISAIFFISNPDNINIPFYWDILTEELLKPKIISDDKYLLIQEILDRIKFAATIEKNISQTQFSKIKSWKVSDQNLNNRTLAYLKISNYIQTRTKNEIDIILKTINKIDSTNGIRKILFDAPLFKKHKIGGHTLNHYNLSQLDKEQQRVEIIDNKIFLEKKFSTEVNYFAYPYGDRHHYNENTVDIVQRSFDISFSNFQGLIHKGSNRHELPRFLVRDWDSKTFGYKIKNFFKSH